MILADPTPAKPGQGKPLNAVTCTSTPRIRFLDAVSGERHRLHQGRGTDVPQRATRVSITAGRGPLRLENQNGSLIGRRA